MVLKKKKVYLYEVYSASEQKVLTLNIRVNRLTVQVFNLLFFNSFYFFLFIYFYLKYRMPKKIAKYF